METTLSLSIILSATAVVVFLYWYFTSTFSYWEKRSVPFVKPLPVFGNVADHIFLRNTSPESYAKIYKKLEGHKFGGFYSGSTPNLILRDPVIIKQIMVKDFNHFIDRNLSFEENISPLACHLFSLTGSRWKKLRVKLTPSFTSVKMRMMLPTIVECSQELVSFLGESADDNNIIEIRNLASNFTTDVIGSCGFGLNINSTKNHDSEFLRMGNKVLQPTILACALRSLGLIFRPIMNLVQSPIARKDVNDFFLGIVKETMSYREKNKVVRNDFLQLLIQLKNKGKIDEDLVSIKDDINVTFTEVASSSNESEDEPLGQAPRLHNSSNNNNAPRTTVKRRAKCRISPLETTTLLNSSERHNRTYRKDVGLASPCQKIIDVSSFAHIPPPYVFCSVIPTFFLLGCSTSVLHINNHLPSEKLLLDLAWTM